MSNVKGMVGHVQSLRSTSLRRVIMLSSKEDEESSNGAGVYNGGKTDVKCYG